MVSWGRAFRGAGAIVGYSIIWMLIGLGIIIAGSYFGIVVGVERYGPFGITYREPNWGVLIASWLIGYIILVLGALAAWLKVAPEIISEEVEKRLKGSSEA